MKTLLTCMLAATLISTAADAAEFAVCLNPDSTLRHVDERQPCKPGEQRFLLEQKTPEKPDIEQESAEVTALRRQIETLNRRIAAMATDQSEMLIQAKRAAARLDEIESRKQRVPAPFEVVGVDGQVILRVASRVSSTTGDGARVTIGRGDTAGYALRVFKADGKPLAGIGESALGAGVVGVSNGTGEPTAIMNGEGREIGVWQAGKLQSAIGVGVNGGMLQLNDQAGSPMVEAGNNGNVGIVRAGPIMRGAAGMFGLPGSFISGKRQ